ncbi:MAG: SEC-C metal-binding domain-containing protein [Dehalococcoidales bacterium]|nr:SEC-C metal-binding domain-containing protein [Dehalococcoidales bacterium]
MAHGRNDSCPCDSGKKYKKCCGSMAGQNRMPDYVAVNRAVAYQGVIGRQREAFCIDYTAFKAAKMVEIESALQQEVASTGVKISCSRGCAHCCNQFVVASLQECECITYYLYQHDKVLDHFIHAFDDWRDRILKIERVFRKINDLGEKINLGQATDEDRRLFDEESRVYASQNNPCPFLVDGACSIYEVRPYICANYFSISPSEWCRPFHPSAREAIHMKIGLKLGNDMPYFVMPDGNRIVSSMPFLVYRILEGGYEELSSITGVEGLKFF